MTKKDCKFNWSKELKLKFYKLCKILTNKPLLAHFVPNKLTQVQNDASRVGVGAILLQNHGSFKTVAYASRQLKPAEKNYTITEQKCLAVVFVLEKLCHCLERIEFKSITDCCFLCFLQSKKKLQPRLVKWSLLLQEFHFKIVYKSGKLHLDAY